MKMVQDFQVFWRLPFSKLPSLAALRRSVLRTKRIVEGKCAECGARLFPGDGKLCEVCREISKTSAAKWREANPEASRQQLVNYRNKNRARVNQYERTYYAQRQLDGTCLKCTEDSLEEGTSRWRACGGCCVMVNLDVDALRDEFRLSNLVRSQQARWCADFPGAEPNTCRYCGRHWRRWAGSKLDGHAACIVTEDFKQRLVVLLRSPEVTYQALADAIGVTPSVVRSWTYPIRRAT